MRPILRAQLRSRPANGHSAFLPAIRKLVFEYCDKWPTSASTRSFILAHAQALARANPHIELVLKQRNQKEPIVRGFYGNTSFLPFLSLLLLIPLLSSQRPRQGHSPQTPPGYRHPEKSTASARLFRRKDTAPQTTPRRKHNRITQGYLEWSPCRPSYSLIPFTSRDLCNIKKYA